MLRGDQLSRPWRLIQSIGRPQGISIDDAARDLSVTIRTVWRNLENPAEGWGSRFTGSVRTDGIRAMWRVAEEFKRTLPFKMALGEAANLDAAIAANLKELGHG